MLCYQSTAAFSVAYHGYFKFDSSTLLHSNSWYLARLFSVLEWSSGGSSMIVLQSSILRWQSEISCHRSLFEWLHVKWPSLTHISIRKCTKDDESVWLRNRLRQYLPKPRFGHSANRHDGIDITSEAHNLCSHCSSLHNDFISPSVGELWWRCIGIIGHSIFHVLEEQGCQTQQRRCQAQ